MKERRLVALNTIKLRITPVEGNFYLSHLKRIHYRLFSEIYTWAGKLRDIAITKGGTIFAQPTRIEPEFQKLHQCLLLEDFSTMPEQCVAERLAYYLGEINILHPFREGNGRTQREYLVQLARKNGYQLHFNGVTQDEMVEASIASSRYADNVLFTKIILKRLSKID